MDILAAAPSLFSATLKTLQLFLGGAALALVLAFAAGLCRTSSSRLLAIIGTIYAELFRGVSLAVQFFWLFFALPAFGISLSETFAAIVGLGLCFGAYGSEIVRTSILAVPKGQREAAASLGLTGLKANVLIVIPQAVFIMLPPFGNLLIQLLKSTSVAALITVPELSFQSAAINNNFGGGLGLFAIVLLIYFLLSRCILWSVTRVESRFGRHLKTGR